MDYDITRNTHRSPQGPSTTHRIIRRILLSHAVRAGIRSQWTVTDNRKANHYSGESRRDEDYVTLGTFCVTATGFFRETMGHLLSGQRESVFSGNRSDQICDDSNNV